jgi:DNA-binding PadR family transcriptional regulator
MSVKEAQTRMARQSEARPSDSSNLTIADIVVLTLLAERPMHGYEVSQELKRREVRDWAGVSRPQVYYSLKKLRRLGYTEPLPRPRGRAPAKGSPGLKAPDTPGPDPHTVRPTPAGRRALAVALARQEWTNQRPAAPFLTWLAVSSQVNDRVFAQQLGRRRAFLEAELEKERRTLEAIEHDSGPMTRVAKLMVTLTIRQFEAELRWLEEVRASGRGGADGAERG